MAVDPSSPPARFVGSGPGGLITETEARALLDELAGSGMTLRDFARSKGFKPQRLDWWRAKFAGKHKHRSRTKTPRAASAPRFVPVVADTHSLTHRTSPSAAVVPAPRGLYELALPGAVTLRIPHDFHDESLARILRVLHEAR